LLLPLELPLTLDYLIVVIRKLSQFLELIGLVVLLAFLLEFSITLAHNTFVLLVPLEVRFVSSVALFSRSSLAEESGCLRTVWGGGPTLLLTRSVRRGWMVAIDWY